MATTAAISNDFMDQVKGETEHCSAGTFERPRSEGNMLLIPRIG
jgi:hypothetical protein